MVTGDLVVRVERQDEIDRGLLELTAKDHGGHALRAGRGALIEKGLEGANLLVERGPDAA